MWIKINETSFRYEDKGVRFFLLLGTECALLIDSGMTVTNARELAAEVTSLPVKLFNTHTDPDHIGSNEEFSEVMINPAELVNYRKPHTSQNIIPVFDGEPTRTHYEQSKSAINRRFCYNQKEYQLSDTLSFFVHRLTYNIRNGIIETQILCCIALSLTGSFVIKKARLEL